ncbi:ChaN family lipoprotein [Mucilaginibacter sabulilitoris]|uniref:ChaN family lipoprotein n=1 Tax=Mucilaginibacter sabulilitoris TaxID=1173583 RepID=A0ABZ0TZ33_9SPHI|nr:ChaN family lipoprotein [Mucilaginibacter sabulilitoris]WPU96785.1 ChaN family lipoprotein [Mucilaginibacter sabulilitoris]
MKSFIILLLTCLPSIVFGQDISAEHYKTYNTSTQKPATIADIINQTNKADVLFFGEEHNDSTAHYLEYILFKGLAEKYPHQTALSMEMFQTDCQLVLNEYLNGLIREKNMISDARAWPNYTDYRPLVELAKSNQLAVIAANAPTRYTNMVTRNGLNSLQLLSTQAKSYLAPLPIDTATGAYYDKFVKAMGGHGAMAGMQLYQSQNLWDATMGWSIAQFFKTHPNFKILQLNGGFHSEEKQGVVNQLKKYAPNVRILTIAAYNDSNPNNPDWVKYKQLADYIILTDPELAKN